MRFLSRRPLLVGTTALLAFVLVGLGVAMARATHRAGPFAKGGHRGLTVKKALPATRTTSRGRSVITEERVQRDPGHQAQDRDPDPRREGRQRPDHDPGQARRRKLYRRYHALNAFAAQVSANERTALQRDAAVKQVIPDTVVQLPGPIGDPAVSAASKAPRAASPGTTTPNGQTLCPADPSKPLLEPEALQTTHTAFDDPNTPQAQNLAHRRRRHRRVHRRRSGHQQPRLRPSGRASSVITDYQDFSGDGLNAPTNSLEAFGDASSHRGSGHRRARHLAVREPGAPAAGGLQHHRPRVAPAPRWSR